MKFSVLMSIYYKEKSEYLNRCMQSVWNEQILKPDEIVLVQDGELTDELYREIEKWKTNLGDVFKTIPLEKNVGLGDALGIGLLNCSNEIVARMDTDDIAYPERFEVQMTFLKENPEIDVLSSWVTEFDGDENNITSIKKLPLSHEKIMQFTKSRNPMSHPPAIFRKQAVIQAGNYKSILQEDYYLWVRMLDKGFKFANQPNLLVNMRAGHSLIRRRKGFKYFIQESKIHYMFYQMKFISSSQLVKNISIRFIMRLMPSHLLKHVYSIIRKRA